MNQEIYADAISAVHVTGNIVRMDLMTLQPQLKSDNGQPVVDISRRVIMPLEGFIQSLNVQDTIVKQLLEAGILKKNLAVADPAGTGATAMAAVSADTALAASQPAAAAQSAEDAETASDNVVHLVNEKG